MHSPIVMHDDHVRAKNDLRLQQAMMHRLVRLARAGQPSGISRIIANVRAMAATRLITLGHRLQAQAVPPLEIHAGDMRTSNHQAI